MPRTDYIAFDTFIENADDEDFDRWYEGATDNQRQHADAIREEVVEEEVETEVEQVERRERVIDRIRRFFRFGR